MSKLEKQIKASQINLYNLEKNYDISRGTMYGLLDNTKKWANITLKTAINLCIALNCKLSDLIENDKTLLEAIKKYERIKQLRQRVIAVLIQVKEMNKTIDWLKMNEQAKNVEAQNTQEYLRKVTTIDILEKEIKILSELLYKSDKGKDHCFFKMCPVATTCYEPEEQKRICVSCIKDWYYDQAKKEVIKN